MEEVDLHITVCNVGLPRNPIFWTYNVLVASPRYINIYIYIYIYIYI